MEGNKLKNKLILFIVLLGMLSLVACSTDTLNTLSTSGNSSTPKITKEAFGKLVTGMSYEEVTEIIGFEGELITESGSPGGTGLDIHTVMYMYEGKGSLGANANLMFQDNKLLTKAQVGLK